MLTVLCDGHHKRWSPLDACAHARTPRSRGGGNVVAQVMDELDGEGF